MLKIVVASKNPVKIQAVQAGFAKMFNDELVVEGVAVPSGVKDQPDSDSETLAGAYNRATAAKQQSPAADYWVGLEGGIEVKTDEIESFAWIVVMAKGDKIIGKGRTGTFFLPPLVAEQIHAGKELGDASDVVFGESHSGQKNGTIGLLTGDAVTRTSYYTEAVVFALIPFRNKNLY